jgi:hypothetical protein
MSTQTKLEIGSIYQVVFLDHAEGDEVYTIRLVGELVKKTRSSITLGCWLVDRPRYEPDDPNQHVYTILRSTIKSIAVLSLSPENTPTACRPSAARRSPSPVQSGEPPASQ